MPAPVCTIRHIHHNNVSRPHFLVDLPWRFIREKRPTQSQRPIHLTAEGRQYVCEHGNGRLTDILIEPTVNTAIPPLNDTQSQSITTYTETTSAPSSPDGIADDFAVEAALDETTAAPAEVTRSAGARIIFRPSSQRLLRADHLPATVRSALSDGGESDECAAKERATAPSRQTLSRTSGSGKRSRRRYGAWYLPVEHWRLTTDDDGGDDDDTGGVDRSNDGADYRLPTLYSSQAYAAYLRRQAAAAAALDEKFRFPHFISRMKPADEKRSNVAVAVSEQDDTTGHSVSNTSTTVCLADESSSSHSEYVYPQPFASAVAKSTTRAASSTSSHAAPSSSASLSALIAAEERADALSDDSLRVDMREVRMRELSNIAMPKTATTSSHSTAHAQKVSADDVIDWDALFTIDDPFIAAFAAIHECDDMTRR